MNVTYIAIFAFVVVATLQYFVLGSIRSRLLKNHPEAIAAIEAESWPKRLKPFSGALSKWLGKGKFKYLNDPKISGLARMSSILGWLTIFIWLILVLSILRVF